MRVPFFIISLILIVNGFSQDLVPKKSIFDKEVELSIDYLMTTMSQSEGNNLEVDTSEFLSYKVMVSPQMNDNYTISINEFIPRLELSNLEALNTLYHDFIKEQKYDLECDLGMSNPKINNIKYIYGLAEKYKPKIDKIKTNIFMYPNDNMVYYKDVSIPDEKFEIVDKCILLVSPIFDGYDVDISKEYEYPHEVKLSYLNTLFNDTLFYKTKSISNRIQEIEISFYSDSGEINNALKELKELEKREGSINDFEMFNCIKYNIDKASGKIIGIIINSGMTSSSDKYEMKIEYRINYSG
jgi:hypothetical protein